MPDIEETLEISQADTASSLPIYTQENNNQAVYLLSSQEQIFGRAGTMSSDSQPCMSVS